MALPGENLSERPISALITELAHNLNEFPDIHAAWLEGSFGRGAHDRWSDIDLHLLVSPEVTTKPEEFALRLKPHSIKFLHIYPVVPNHVCQAVGHKGVRLDIVVHRSDTHTICPNTCSVLHDPQKKLAISEIINHPSAHIISSKLSTMIYEFWRVHYMTPVVVGRDELVIAHQGMVSAATLLGRILALASGQEVESGIKRLEIFLSAEQSTLLRDAIRGPFEDFASIVRANYRLMDIMRAEGPKIAARLGFSYPKDFEAAVLEYLREELSLLGVLT